MLAGLGDLTRPPHLLASLVDSPFTRDLLARLFGRLGAELVCHLTCVLARALGGDLFSLLSACLKALLWLAGALAPVPLS